MTDAEAADYGRCISALLAAGYSLLLEADELYVPKPERLWYGGDPVDVARKAALALGVQW